MAATTGEAPSAAEEWRAVRCPQCGVVTEQLRRYPVWCEHCAWNVDPQPPELPRSRWARRLQRRADHQARGLYTTMLARGTAASVTAAERVLLLALAVLVHLLTLSLLVVAGWLWTIQDLFRPVTVVGTVLLVGLFWVLRPRVRDADIRGIEVDRSTAPAVFALLDELSQALDAPLVQRMFMQSGYNAACGRSGLRRTTVLALGAPLWSALSPPQRIALLGHEIGHLRNGDASRGLVVSTAQEALDTWTSMLLPDVARWRRMTAYSSGFGFRATTAQSLAAAERIGAVLVLPLALLVYLLGRAMDALRLRDSQRAEYFADDLGSRLAGSTDFAALLDVLMLADSARLALRRTPAGGGTTSMWDSVRAALDSVPERERARLRRLAAQRLQTADSTHPPTYLRRELQLARPQPTPALPNRGRWALLDAELAAPLAAIAAALSRAHPAPRAPAAR